MDIDKFKAKIDNEGLYSDDWKIVCTRRIDKSTDIQH